MTEEQWFLEPNWELHFEFLGERLSLRKQRLLAAGFCRLIWDYIESPEVREAIEIAERSVDDGATVAQLEQARKRCREMATKSDHRASELAGEERRRAEFDREVAWLGAFITNGQFRVEEISKRCDDILALAKPQALQNDMSGIMDIHRIQQKLLLLDLVFNPSRPVTFSLTWRTSTVASLASQMLESGDFAAMPILADALEDAGCENPWVLKHCREPRLHHRGCWVVDGILGKS